MNRFLSTPPVFAVPVAGINREQGIIQGIAIARIGPAKGHGGFIDRTFLLQIVDNAASRTAGIKARFGHPNMCSQALGTYLGRFKNYSYSGDFVRADLHLDETAHKTPSGDLFSYVLDMAEKNPDMFGASIVFEIGESVFLEEEVNGEKVKNEFFRLKDLRATDIVDEPAATEGLFSAGVNGPEAFPAIATQFLDENPALLELIFSKPGTVPEFLSNYITNSKMNLSDKIKQNFSAFLAAFATPDQPAVQVPASVSDSGNSTLETLFAAVSTSYPESFKETEGFTHLQKAEALTAFISSFSDQLEAANNKLTETTAALETLTTEHESLLSAAALTQTEIEGFQTEVASLKEQLSARPSIPLNVTDPALSLTTNQDKDETGKQILASMPKDMKRKLKTSI